MKWSFVVVLVIMSLTSVGAQTQGSNFSQCTVLEVSNATVQGQSLEQDDVLSSETVVSVEEDGRVVLVCDDGFREVTSGQEGSLQDIAVRTDEFNTDLPASNQSIDEEELKQALRDTEQIEENLVQVNKMIDESIPGPIASIILGDNVNLQIDNTTVGIETNSSGITDVVEGGFEEPDLVVSMDAQAIERIMTSEDTANQFREEYNGDGINIEAYTWRNRISLGVVNTASRVYGFISGFT